MEHISCHLAMGQILFFSTIDIYKHCNKGGTNMQDEDKRIKESKESADAELKKPPCRKARRHKELLYRQFIYFLLFATLTLETYNRSCHISV